MVLKDGGVVSDLTWGQMLCPPKVLAGYGSYCASSPVPGWLVMLTVFGRGVGVSV